MPTKSWEIPLEDGFKILCRKETFFGRWVGFAVVLVKDEACITRYDSAHGFAHRDVLGERSGLLSKESCGIMSFREAFGHGIEDFRAAYRAHHDFYRSH